MPGRSALVATLAVALALAAQAPLLAQVPPAFQPSLGDLMTMLVQPRHVKLGLAGEQRNWTYAAYELRELQGAFRRLGRAVPTYRSTDMAALIEATTSAPIADVEAAIKAGDAGKFADAYAQLTSTCTSCHQSTDHGAIVIQVPRASSFPDQDFRTVQP